MTYKETATTDNLATLHIDHETWDLWVDVHRNATPATGAEIIKLAKLEGCYVIDTEDCDPVHLPGDIVRYYLAHLEAT